MNIQTTSNFHGCIVYRQNIHSEIPGVNGGRGPTLELPPITMVLPYIARLFTAESKTQRTTGYLPSFSTTT